MQPTLALEPSAWRPAAFVKKKSSPETSSPNPKLYGSSKCSASRPFDLLPVRLSPSDPSLPLVFAFVDRFVSRRFGMGGAETGRFSVDFHERCSIPRYQG